MLLYLWIFTQIQQVMTNREQGHYYLTSHKKFSEVKVLWYHSYLVWFIFKVLSRSLFSHHTYTSCAIAKLLPLLTANAQCMESSHHLQQPRYNTPPGSMHTLCFALYHTLGCCSIHVICVSCSSEPVMSKLFKHKLGSCS